MVTYYPLPYQKYQSMQKWETIMTDALVRIRDLAEKRVAPACQRLHLLLQEVQGWAAL